MGTRLLVMGDNHGDAESLQRVLQSLSGAENIDVAVHVGDFTSARRTTRERGADKLAVIEPYLERIDALATEGLLWVWGNKDYFGDLDAELTVGTRIPRDGHVSRAGQRFTNDPSVVQEESILVTHMERWALVDHFDGRAHFCGNTHRGRVIDYRLNTAFLAETDPDTDTTHYGGYFIVDLEADATMAVQMRSIGSLERRHCPEHAERGIQFQRADRACMFCADDRVLYRELAASAFYGLTECGDTEAPSKDDLLEYVSSLWDEPPKQFRAGFRSYLADIESDRYAPLSRRADGTYEVSEDSYAY